jgi:hypothetical protein
VTRVHTRRVAAKPKHGARKIHLQTSDGTSWRTACAAALTAPKPLPDEDPAPVTCRRCVNSGGVPAPWLARQEAIA